MGGVATAQVENFREKKFFGVCEKICRNPFDLHIMNMAAKQKRVKG